MRPVISAPSCSAKPVLRLATSVSLIYRLRGRPRAFSAIRLRWISLVPP